MSIFKSPKAILILVGGAVVSLLLALFGSAKKKQGKAEVKAKYNEKSVEDMAEAVRADYLAVEEHNRRATDEINRARNGDRSHFE